MRFSRWLYPGLGIKRWLLLFAVGLVFLVVGGAIIIDVRALALVEEAVRHAVLVVTREPSAPAPWLAAGVLLGLGLLTTTVAVRQLVRSLVRGIAGDQVEESGLAERLYVRWHLTRGPRVVALGGGTGLPVLLRGLKDYTDNITAIVTVADDGGSSGRLRGELGILPPGDIRNCLVALADTEPLMEQLLQHRFDQGSLKGHTVGNVLIGGMTELSGDFQEAIRQLSRVLAVRGQVLPSALEQVVLRAELEDGTCLEGESAIGRTSQRIRRIELVPPRVTPPAEAVCALRRADVIVVGPGSLFTSIIPNLLVPELRQAYLRSEALKIYVCNVMTQPGETSGFTAADHVRALERHVGKQAIDYVIVNTEPVNEALLTRYREQGAEPVRVDRVELLRMGVQPLEAAVIEQTDVARHDPARLGAVIMGLVLRSEITLRKMSIFDIHLLQERYYALLAARAREKKRARR